MRRMRIGQGERIPRLKCKPTFTQSSLIFVVGFFLSACQNLPFKNKSQTLDLALHVVSYSVIDFPELESILDKVNKLYKPCELAFRVEEFQTISKQNLKEKGLKFEPEHLKDLMTTRLAFSNTNKLLVIATGSFKKDSELAKLKANAWTMARQDKPQGSVIEARGIKDVRLLAHELGHYLGLNHEEENSNLMHATLYKHSKDLNESQCQLMRHQALTLQARALRPHYKPFGLVASIPSFE